ncbi:MAG: hypothetical protein QM711_00270 [Micropruina sp.]|uniref:hypothetical protein n=1 Tax=Micropruina sp. TaxID=2737536 RepID=UPI0039E5C689
MSDDRTLTKRNIYLDGEIPAAGSVRASFRPTGGYNDEQNNVVHTEEFTGFSWVPWIGAACSAVASLGCAVWWWTRTGRKIDRWLGRADILS